MGKNKTASSFFRICIAGPALLSAAYVSAIRPWHLRWGASDDETTRTLPGDEFVPQPKLNATHAISIHAPVTHVWPWLAQMGQGRGGLYSYDWLENLAGLNFHSADHIIPEMQDLKVGDILPLAPNNFGPPVRVLEPNRVLVAAGAINPTTGKEADLATPNPGPYFSVAWIFYLDPIDDRTTRLIERFRLDWNPSLVNSIAYRAFLEPASFVMERKMLLGIKQRAEALAARSP